jgi:radical SAM superfamily enzyme YgiQ (UPF0313 family)
LQESKADLVVIGEGEVTLEEIVAQQKNTYQIGAELRVWLITMGKERLGLIWQGN